jgi:hypothetical protein
MPTKERQLKLTLCTLYAFVNPRHRPRGKCKNPLDTASAIRRAAMAFKISGRGKFAEIFERQQRLRKILVTEIKTAGDENADAGKGSGDETVV